MLPRRIGIWAWLGAAAMHAPVLAQDFPAELAAFERKVPPAPLAARSATLRSLPGEGPGVRLPREADAALLRAARARDWPTLVALLKDGQADPDTSDDSGATALSLAAREGALEPVRALVRHGADLERRGAAGLSPLACAVLGGHAEVVRLLLRAGADAYASGGAPQPPLHWAAQLGQLHIVDALLAEGVDPERRNAQGQTALRATFLARRWDALEVLSQAVARKRQATAAAR